MPSGRFVRALFPRVLCCLLHSISLLVRLTSSPRISSFSFFSNDGATVEPRPTSSRPQKERASAESWNAAGSQRGSWRPSADQTSTHHSCLATHPETFGRLQVRVEPTACVKPSLRRTHLCVEPTFASKFCVEPTLLRTHLDSHRRKAPCCKALTLGCRWASGMQGFARLLFSRLHPLNSTHSQLASRAKQRARGRVSAALSLPTFLSNLPLVSGHSASPVGERL